VKKDAGPLRELALLFLRLGTIAFGGPAAHIAMMEEEVVERRRWLSRERFLDLLGATNLIPGPNSTEMAIHIGYLRAGWPGLLTSGACFIFPAAILVWAAAWAYVRFGALPEAEAILYGVKPVIIAVVLQALLRLTKTALKTKTLIALSILAAAANVLGMNELLVLFLVGLLTALAHWTTHHGGAEVKSLWLPLLSVPSAKALGGASVVAFGLGPLFLFFFKVGSVLFGSGYVLLAFLRADLVENWGWMTEGQLLDAIAVSQVTPGPVFTAATFIGYLMGGTQGAVVATLGIFIPAFFFVAVSGPLVKRIRRSPVAGAFLDGVVAASLALMAVVTWQLGRSALVDLPTVLLGALSALALLRYRVNSAWLILAGAVLGVGLYLARLP
jgi:chromate transporter